MNFEITDLNETYNAAYRADGILIAKYAMSLKLLKTEKKVFIVEVNREDLTAGEDAGIQNHAFDLAAACGKILYPVEIILDEQAHVTGINNHKEIVHRWLKQAPALSAYYTGDAVESYLAQTEQALMNADTVAASMRRDFFISAFFMPLTFNIRDGNIVNMRRTFYLPAEATAEIEQSASIIDAEKDLFRVRLSARSLPDEPVSFEAEGCYVLRKSSCKIESVDFTRKMKQGDKPCEISIKIEVKR